MSHFVFILNYNLLTMFSKFSDIVVFIVYTCVLSVQCSFDRSAGEQCHTEQARGSCVHVYKCLSSLLDLTKNKHPPICSFEEREPIVCCTDCELVNDTRNAIIDKEGGIFFRSGQKARDKCIEHLTYLPYSCQTNGLERYWNEENQCNTFEQTFTGVVLGGNDAERSRYPHMALLGYGTDEDSAQWLCGGSLISEKFVLTAAHCISASSLGAVRFIAMGILKRSDPDELWRVYNVMRIIAHPEYSPPSKYHDIALLETDKPVVFSKDVFPACIDFEQQPQGIAFATGWGKLGKNRPLADNLQEVTLEEFSQEDCLKHFPPHRLLAQGYAHGMQMCYGDSRQPKDTCEGDSGGPLQVTSLISKCLYTIIGVTSYGRACGYAGDAGMYTRVHHYVRWIESVVWPSKAEYTIY